MPFTYSFGRNHSASQDAVPVATRSVTLSLVSSVRQERLHARKTLSLPQRSSLAALS